jgi:hypothetical protein
MIYVKVNSTLYPASVSGKISDKEWDGRESKAITMAGPFAAVDALFPDGTAWSIVNEDTVPVMDEEGSPVLDENGEPTYTTQQTEFDNSEFNIRGDLIVHVDGTCTVKMGKLTELEQALSGAVTTAELDAAYTEGVNEA